MTTLSSSRPFAFGVFSAGSATAAFFALASEAMAHETGVPHGMGEHLALYVGAAGLLAVAAVVLSRLGHRRAERRVRVEKDDPRRESRRR